MLYRRHPFRQSVLLVVVLLTLTIVIPLGAQRAQTRTQPIDEAYTAKIKEYTQDPRVITELVDHCPRSDTVPSPLKVLGRIPGTPGRAHVLEGHLPVLRRARQGLRSGQGVPHRQDRRRAAT